MEHSQDSSKFGLLVCLSVLNNFLPFLVLEDRTLFNTPKQTSMQNPELPWHCSISAKSLQHPFNQTLHLINTANTVLPSKRPISFSRSATLTSASFALSSAYKKITIVKLSCKNTKKMRSFKHLTF